MAFFQLADLVKERKQARVQPEAKETISEALQWNRVIA